MATEDTKSLFVLRFPDRAKAEAAVTELTELQRDQYIQVRDHAIVSKEVGGAITVTESKDRDPGAQRGAVAGGLGAAFVALAATPIGAGAIVVGAGIGAITAALRDSGFKSQDLGEVGRLMQDGKALLILEVRPEDRDRLRTSLTDTPELLGQETHWEAELSAESKNMLADAIQLWNQREAQSVDDR